ncbi:putative sensor histidine kinase pdtaS [compost metagenome]
MLPSRRYFANSSSSRTWGTARRWLNRRVFFLGVTVFALSLTASLWFLIEELVRKECESRVREVVLQNENLARLIEDHATRMLDAQGDVDAAEFAGLYADLEIGKQGAISLVGLDGIVRVRVKAGQQSSGQDVSQAPPFQRMLQTPKGSFESIGVLDGVARISAYRRLANRPLFVVVGSAVDEVLADVRLRAFRYRQGAVLASVVIAGAAIWLMLLWRRQQKTEAAFRASDRFLRTLTDIIPGMVSYWTPDLRCSFANQDYFNWFGQRPEQILGQHIRTLLGPELYERNAPHIQAALKGQTQQFERCLSRADGSLGTTWVHYIPDVYRGEVRGFAVWAADLTPIRQAQQTLEQLHASIRIAAIAFECQEGMVVTDAERIILRVNHAFTVMTGFTGADVIGRRHVELKSARHGAQFDNALWAEVRGVGGWSGEFWHRHHSQGEFPVRATVTAVTDQGGGITNYVFTLIDVTGQHQREVQRHREEQMQRDALVREVHHRIKNNLQGIAGLLRQFEYAQPETREAMTQAIGQVQSIAVIHGLQGQGATERVRVDALVRAIAQTLLTLRQSSITLGIPSHWSAWELAEADAVPIALILNELMLNAIKHGTPQGTDVEVTLTEDLVNESLQVWIVNRGQLSGTQGPTAFQAHMGLSLVASLMPRRGGRLMQSELDGNVVTTLTLADPVVTRAALADA